MYQANFCLPSAHIRLGLKMSGEAEVETSVSTLVLQGFKPKKVSLNLIKCYFVSAQVIKLFNFTYI